MKMKKNRRRQFFANKMHRELFLLIFFAAVLPAGIVTVLLYYLIFGITADQVAIPEAIAYNIIPAAKRVIVILSFAVPISIMALLILAYKLSHRIVGPFDRLIREIDESIEGKRKAPLRLRKADRFRPLVDRINKLLDRFNA